MKKFIQLLLIVFISSGTSLQAKNPGIIITGKVVSFEESLGLEGVSVVVKGTDYSTGTQSDGTFSLNVDSQDVTLVFALQDYQTSEIKISKDSSDYLVILKRNDSNNTASKPQKVYHLHISK